MKHLRLVAAAGVAGALWAGPAIAVEQMRAIGFIPKTHPVLVQANVWVDKINEGLEGKVRVNYIGGPEVVGRHQQIDAVRNGVMDIVFPPSADYQDLLQEVSAFTLSRLSPSEERTSGFYDFMVAAHERINTRYLGRVQMSPFYLWTKREPKSLSDLRGLKMRTGSLYDRFMQQLGMVPVTISAGETYTALERGVVDGFGWPVTGPRQQGWLRQVGYVIDLPFFPASNVVILMHLDRWKKLPADLQKRIEEITATFEPGMIAYFTEQNESEWREIGDQVKRVKFSEDENRKYLDTAYAVEWEAIGRRLPAENVAKLRQLTGN